VALRVSPFLDRLARLLSEGRTEDFARLHHFPVAYEAHGTLRVFLRPADLAQAVGDWRERQWGRGVREVVARVAAQDLGRSGRVRVWAEWTHRMADGTTESGGTDLLYLSHNERGGLAVEMIDFLSLPAPQEAPEEAADGPGAALLSATG
jgi:hypothetical protein